MSIVVDVLESEFIRTDGDMSSMKIMSRREAEADTNQDRVRGSDVSVTTVIFSQLDPGAFTTR